MRGVQEQDQTRANLQIFGLQVSTDQNMNLGPSIMWRRLICWTEGSELPFFFFLPCVAPIRVLLTISDIIDLSLGAPGSMNSCQLLPKELFVCLFYWAESFWSYYDHRMTDPSLESRVSQYLFFSIDHDKNLDLWFHETWLRRQCLSWQTWAMEPFLCVAYSLLRRTNSPSCPFFGI